MTTTECIVTAYVNDKHIKYRRPFRVEKHGRLTMGVDAGGLNCVTLAGYELAIGVTDSSAYIMEHAVKCLNEAQDNRVFFKLVSGS